MLVPGSTHLWLYLGLAHTWYHLILPTDMCREQATECRKDQASSLGCLELA